MEVGVRGQSHRMEHSMAEQRGLREGARSGMTLNTISYISSLDGFPEHVHYIFPFTVSGLKTFGPPNECSLKERKGNSLSNILLGLLHNLNMK